MSKRTATACSCGPQRHATRAPATVVAGGDGLLQVLGDPASCLREAGALLNGTSIQQLDIWTETTLTYYNIELERHGLITANDLLAESYFANYRDGELTRVAWSNYDNYLSLYGSSKTMDDLPMPRIPFSRQPPLRIREQFGLLSSYGPSSSGASRDELCLML